MTTTGTARAASDMVRGIAYNYANVGAIVVGAWMRTAGMKLNTAGVALQVRSSRAIQERAARMQDERRARDA